METTEGTGISMDEISRECDFKRINETPTVGNGDGGLGGNGTISEGESVFLAESQGGQIGSESKRSSIGVEIGRSVFLAVQGDLAGVGEVGLLIAGEANETGSTGDRSSDQFASGERDIYESQSHHK